MEASDLARLIECGKGELLDTDVLKLIEFGNKIYTSFLSLGEREFFKLNFQESSTTCGLILKCIGLGRHRAVYHIAGSEFVLKFPVTIDGYYDNTREASTIGEHYAKCFMVMNSTILAMEYVERIPYNEMPDWAAYIDCGQVGKTKDGRIVAYDFGW
jgi:hypothetical protein